MFTGIILKRFKMKKKKKQFHWEKIPIFIYLLKAVGIQNSPQGDDYRFFCKNIVDC